MNLSCLTVLYAHCHARCIPPALHPVRVCINAMFCSSPPALDAANSLRKATPLSLLQAVKRARAGLAAQKLEDDTRQLAAEFLVTLAEAREQAPGMMRRLPDLVDRLFMCLLGFLLDIEDDPLARHLSAPPLRATPPRHPSAPPLRATPPRHAAAPSHGASTPSCPATSLHHPGVIEPQCLTELFSSAATPWMRLIDSLGTPRADAWMRALRAVAHGGGGGG